MDGRGLHVSMETTPLLSEHKLHLLQTAKLPLTIAHLSGMINRILFLKCATIIISTQYLTQQINSGSPWVLIMVWNKKVKAAVSIILYTCLLYTSPSPRDGLLSRMPSSA